MTAEQVLEWINTHEIKICPFCGGKLEFYDHTYTNKHGKEIRQMYFMHDETECILNEVGMPFTLGVGNSVEYLEMWNTRKPMDRIVESLEEAMERQWGYYNKAKAEGNIRQMDYSDGCAEGLTTAIEIVEEEM